MTKRILGAFIPVMILSGLFGCGNKNTSEMEFKFSDPKDKAVFTCSHVIHEKSPVLHVTHDIDGDWQFLCGHEAHSVEDAHVISLQNAVELDYSLNDLFEMPNGVGAERKKMGAKWIPFRL